MTNNEDGNISIIVAGGMVTFLLILAMVSDVGLLFVRQQKLQNALDAGALAGIQKIFEGQTAAAQEAQVYVDQNGGTITNSLINTSNLSIDLEGEETVDLWFARVIGLNQSVIKAWSKAKAGTIVAMKGFVPIAVPDQTFTYGAMYQLSSGSGDGNSGNYGFLDFTGGGANALSNNIMYGYNSTIRIGDQIPTITGINHGPVETAIDYRMNQDADTPSCQSYQTANHSCQRILHLPVIDTLDVNGKKPVTIVGFAAFFLEGTDENGGHMTIQGRFLRLISQGEMGTGTNYGLYTVKLTP